MFSNFQACFLFENLGTFFFSFSLFLSIQTTHFNLKTFLGKFRFFASKILGSWRSFYSFSLSLVIFCMHSFSFSRHTQAQKSVKWSKRKARIILIKNVTLGGSKWCFFPSFIHNMRQKARSLSHLMGAWMSYLKWGSKIMNRR
jgi:hypothetical protein